MGRTVFAMKVQVVLVALLCFSFCLNVDAASVSIDNIMTHLQALQTIADMTGGTRAAGTAGYNASRDYIVAQLTENTNYTVTVQNFNFQQTVQVSPPELQQTAPEAITYTRGINFNLMTYTGSGDVTAVSQGVDNDGCSTDDYSTFISGNIALVARGNCDFSTKVDLCVAAGAGGVIIYNYPGEGQFSGTLGSPKTVPVFSTTEDMAKQCLDDAVIVVGSHLDSVPAGPGINDNGSGSATNLELAINLFSSNATRDIKNKVRFAWWAAEELGLLGSEYYVSQAISSGEINNLACNLNFDMLGSPNYFRGVYDGEGADEQIRSGCVKIENLFTHYFGFEGI